MKNDSRVITLWIVAMVLLIMGIVFAGTKAEQREREEAVKAAVDAAKPAKVPCYRWDPDLKTVTVREVAIWIRLWQEDEDSNNKVPNIGNWLRDHPGDPLAQHLRQIDCD